MHEILETLLKEDAIKDVAENFSRRKEFSVFGLSGSQKAAIIAAAFEKNPRPVIIVTESREKISELQRDFAELLPGVNAEEIPEPDLAKIRAETVGLERRAKRLEIFMRLSAGQPEIILSAPAAAVAKDFSRRDFLRSQITIEREQILEREELLKILINAGYERTDEIDSPGKFSVRGEIVDIFSIGSPEPYRINFFDDKVESVRLLNPETLRSKKNLSGVKILPLVEPAGKNAEPFLTCAGEKGTIIFDEPFRIRDAINALVKENPEIKKNIFTFEQLLKNSRAGSLLYLQLMMKKIPGSEVVQSFGITGENMTAFQGQKDFFLTELNHHIERGRKIFILCSGQKKFSEVKNFLDENKIEPGENLILRQGTLNDGFLLPSAKVAVITEQDIFGTRTERKKIRRSPHAGDAIKHFRDIRPGDYVVHETNGIGKYLGIETLEFEGVRRDYLQIQYGGSDKLYLPTDAVNVLQKYVGGEDSIPRLSKLNSGEWARIKSRAKKAVEDIAEKLLEIYAERETAKGFAFAEDDDSQIEFEKKFPYEETPDQLRAILEVKADMESPRPMDRLICGDVGFGKTEVAIRAAYKAAMNGKQVAILAPTTVLALQHYQTFSERLAGFLPTVDLICRFRSPKEQRLTLQKVRAGQVDILIGTHSILNSKVAFKNLGLLIIDEEQRFGVKQKEKIRSLSAGVDILAMSATPIPRTLHMSLTGARDMSLITTPPTDRFPVQTYVIEDDDAIIAEAMRREIRRGGQIYFICNRIEMIDSMSERLTNLVPEAKIRTAHGRQSDIFLENVMADFYEGNFNVLLSTTIVENGLDVPNANTIIIYDADNFGLSQLYQMRGRVGRSHKPAFAYFVHRAMKVLSETAEKRLHAMKEFARLGAGFKIAMRDLEIRGAGNLLGAQQHGHIESVGFEMYRQLLEQAVAKLQNRSPEKIEPEPEIFISVEAYIDDKYISDSGNKIEIYRRLSVVRDDAEIKDIFVELTDRFGKPTEPVKNLLRIARIKCLAKKIGVKTLRQNNFRLEISFDESPKISPVGYNELKKFFKNRFKDFKNSRDIFIDLETKKDILKTVTDILRKLCLRNTSR